MERIADNNLFEIAYDLFSRISNDDFEYVYRGYFTHNITKKILYLADTNIQRLTDRSTIQKRIYNIMVEGLQNITRHQDEIKDRTEQYPGIFAIEKEGVRYYVTTGNLILKTKIQTLKEKIDVINSLDKDELKKFHKEVLATGEISEKGGAGLGLIEMARKSGRKMVYSFVDINDEYAYFYLQTEVPTTADDSEEEAGNVIVHNSIESIKQLHESLSSENILLYFNGFFNQDNLLNLLAIIKGRMDMSITTIKVSNIMVEMLQNIIKHGVQKVPNDEGNPGIFLLSQKHSDIILTSGNYIPGSTVEGIKERLNFINSMSKEELSDYYDRVLLDFELNDSKKTGLGFSDLRIKSDKYLNYNFHNLDEYLTFYILQSAVTNKN